MVQPALSLDALVIRCTDIARLENRVNVEQHHGRECAIVHRKAPDPVVEESSGAALAVLYDRSSCGKNVLKTFC